MESKLISPLNHEDVAVGTIKLLFREGIVVFLLYRNKFNIQNVGGNAISDWMLSMVGYILASVAFTSSLGVMGWL
jgi:hypothetical protein